MSVPNIPRATAESLPRDDRVGSTHKANYPPSVTRPQRDQPSQPRRATAHHERARQPRLILPPATLISAGGSGRAAGPAATEPSLTLNRLWWQGQTMWPSLTEATEQP